MQDLELITKIQRQLRQLYQNVGDSMISGGVDNMEKYKYMLGSGTRLPIYFTGNL
jgi:hypothetical protein